MTDVMELLRAYGYKPFVTGKHHRAWRRDCPYRGVTLLTAVKHSGRWTAVLSVNNREVAYGKESDELPRTLDYLIEDPVGFSSAGEIMFGNEGVWYFVVAAWNRGWTLTEVMSEQITCTRGDATLRVWLDSFMQADGVLWGGELNFSGHVVYFTDEKDSSFVRLIAR